MDLDTLRKLAIYRQSALARWQATTPSAEKAATPAVASGLIKIPSHAPALPLGVGELARCVLCAQTVALHTCRSVIVAAPDMESVTDETPRAHLCGGCVDAISERLAEMGVAALPHTIPTVIGAVVGALHLYSLPCATAKDAAQMAALVAAAHGARNFTGLHANASAGVARSNLSAAAALQELAWQASTLAAELEATNFQALITDSNGESPG